MALNWQALPISFGQGIDTKTDPKQVVAGKLLDLQNGVFTKAKKIIKRFGHTLNSLSVLNGSAITNGQALENYNNELIMYGGNKLYSWSAEVSQWVQKSEIYSVSNANFPVMRNSYQQSSPDLAIVNNVAAYVYQDSHSGTCLTVINNINGTVFQNNTVLSASGVNPRAVSIEDSIFIFYISSTSLKLRILNVQAPHQVGSETTLVSDVNASTHYFDVVGLPDSLLFTYCSSSNTNSIKVGYITATGLLGNIITGYPNIVTINQPVDNALTLVQEPTTGRIAVFYSNATNGLCYTALESDLTTAQSNYVIDSDTTFMPSRLAPYIISSTQVGVLYEKATSSTARYDHYVSQRTLTIVGGGGSNTVVKRSVGLASKAYRVGSDTFCNVVFDTTLQATYFIMRSDGLVISKMMPTQASGLPATHVLPQVTLIGTKAYFPALIKTKVISQNNAVFTQIGLSLEVTDFSPNTQFISRPLNGSLLISGGFIYSYDGAVPVECGFHMFPENVNITAHTTGGNIGAGTYQYFVVYEWMDRNGSVHRSSPSIGQSVVNSGSTSSNTIVVPTLRVTKKTASNGSSEVVISVYRTQNGLTTPFKVTSVTSPTVNDSTSDTVTFTDTLSDSSIGSNEILYTSGGILENDAPPSASIIDISKNRALITGLEDPYTFGYSKQAVSGEGVSFSLEFLTRVDPLGGPVTAIKFMDDKIIIFKRSAIFYISGKGPDDTGQNNDFSEPILITSDSGCDNQKSIVLMPQGLMYQSDKGIYLLERSLNNSYVGAEVEDYNEFQVTSGTLLADENQVRFLTNNGLALVYDYFFNQWSTFTNHGGVGACLWQNTTYAYVRSNGQVYIQDSNSHLDGAEAYPLVIKTSWLKLALLQGFQRVKYALALGDFLSDHKIRVQVAYDYEPFFSYQYLWDASAVLGNETYGNGNYGDDPEYGGLSSAVEQFRINLQRQKCESIQFQLDDIENPMTEPGYALSELALLVGQKAGSMKLPLAKKVGT